MLGNLVRLTFATLTQAQKSVSCISYSTRITTKNVSSQYSTGNPNHNSHMLYPLYAALVYTINSLLTSTVAIHLFGQQVIIFPCYQTMA